MDYTIEDGSSIFSLKKSNTTLMSLNLQRNNIGDEGAVKIAKSREKNTTRINFDLGDNKISEDMKKMLGIK